MLKYQLNACFDMVFGFRKKKLEDRLERIERGLAYVLDKIGSDNEVSKSFQAKSGSLEDKELSDEELKRLLQRYYPVDIVENLMDLRKLRKVVRKLRKQYQIEISKKLNKLMSEKESYDIEAPKLDGDNLDFDQLLDSLPTPFKMAVNMFLKNKFGVSLDDIRRDPSCLAPILSFALEKVKESSKKKEKPKESKSSYQGYEVEPFIP